jgi:hypothetical protein
MNHTDDDLQLLARRIYGAYGEDVRDRATLEADLVPMIRCAMRTGRGQPAIVAWVKRNLPAFAPSTTGGPPVDPNWAAPRMARLMCAQMLHTVRAEQDRATTRETIVGR